MAESIPNSATGGMFAKILEPPMSRMGAEMSEVGIGDLVFIRVIRAIRGLVGYGRTFSL